jgi:hypothetical protein
VVVGEDFVGRVEQQEEVGQVSRKKRRPEFTGGGERSGRKPEARPRAAYAGKQENIYFKLRS